MDLRNGQSQYLSTIKQLVDALPKTVDPSSCFELQGHIARPGQKRFRRSMRVAIWYLLPSDGIFRRSPTSSNTFSHARDGVWSYEGVMWPTLRGTVT